MSYLKIVLLFSLLYEKGALMHTELCTLFYAVTQIISHVIGFKFQKTFKVSFPEYAFVSLSGIFVVDLFHCKNGFCHFLSGLSPRLLPFLLVKMKVILPWANSELIQAVFHGPRSKNPLILHSLHSPEAWRLSRGGFHLCNNMDCPFFHLLAKAILTSVHMLPLSLFFMWFRSICVSSQ